MTDNGDDAIRELLLDLPLRDMPQRPEGMLAIRRSDVPAERRDDVDAWVQARGGHIGHEPLIVVHGGKSPDSGPPGEAFYALPPTAFAE
jgi:hypothetical protein